MMRQIFRASCVLILAGMAALPGHASTITITFAEPTLTVLPGQQGVAVLATLTNTDPVNTVFLNSDNISLPGAGAINDEFFTNAPLSLDPGQVSGPIELFAFDVAANAVPAALTGSYGLLGGVGTGNEFNFDAIGAQTFSINILAAPEPSAMLLLGFGLMAMPVLVRRRLRNRDRAA